MKHRSIIPTTVALLLLFLVFLPAPSRAQGQDDADRLDEEIQRTDEIIAFAADVVEQARSQKGRVKLEQARLMQENAKRSRESRALAFSYKLTVRARNEAQQAASLARQDARIQEQTNRMVEETGERLMRVREMAAEHRIRAERLSRMIDEARELVEKARLNQSQYRYQIANRLAENARQRTMHAEQEVRRLRALEQLLERRIAAMERLMERVRDRADSGADETAGQLYKQARDQYGNAVALREQGRYRAARLAVEECEKTLRTLMRRRVMEEDAGMAMRIEEARRLADRAAEMTAGDGAAAGEVEQARRMIERAGEALAAGRDEEAARIVARVRERLRAVVREENGTGGADEEIGRAENLMASVREIAAGCDAPGVETMMRRAEDHLDAARARLAEGREKNAAAEARIAANMFIRVRELCEARL